MAKSVIMIISMIGGVLWKYGYYAIFSLSQERKT